MSYIPTREEIVAKLDGLCNGTENRDEVSAWACTIFLNDDIKIEDEMVQSALSWLGMVDTLDPSGDYCRGVVDAPASDRDYLYGISDFETWKAEILNPKST